MLTNMKWNDINTPMLISLWLFCLIMARIAFDRSCLRGKVPESTVLILAGLIFGVIFDVFMNLDMNLPFSLFFIYLLPPIVLDAGYSLNNKLFFNNIKTIMLFAVVGTMLSVILISAQLFAMNDFYEEPLSLMNIVIFAVIISAIDPVAVLSVFEEIHVNHVLNIVVFGESLLNDAVTIVLYNAVNALMIISTTHALIAYDFYSNLIDFVAISAGGIAIGLVAGVIVGAVTKYTTDRMSMIQPLTAFTIPYVSYLFCEKFHISGILAIVTCGLSMKKFLVGNLNRDAMITVGYFLRTASSCCEALIFVFLGLSTFSKNHSWDFVFTAVTIFAITSSRLIVVFSLSYIANKRRIVKIPFNDQIIIAYGGLRGAIAYGLVCTLDSSLVPQKEMLISTTIAVIIMTVFIQGSTIKKLVEWLQVKRQDPHVADIAEKVISMVIEDLIIGIELISGRKGYNYYRRYIMNKSEQLLQPMMKHPQTRGEMLVERLATTVGEEYRGRLLSSTSYRDHDKSLTNIPMTSMERVDLLSRTRYSSVNEGLPGSSLADNVSVFMDDTPILDSQEKSITAPDTRGLITNISIDDDGNKCRVSHV